MSKGYERLSTLFHKLGDVFGVRKPADPCVQRPCCTEASACEVKFSLLPARSLHVLAKGQSSGLEGDHRGCGYESERKLRATSGSKVLRSKGLEVR
jgi:hypothetical protein